MIVIVAGPAGSGKSTLGLELARSQGLPLLDLDTITNPLLDSLAPLMFSGKHWNDANFRDLVRPARYAALLATIVDQRLTDVGAVVVAPFTRELDGGAEWKALVSAAGGEPTVIWLKASPELLTVRRSRRGADRDAHVVNSASGTPAVPHLAVDAELATPQQLAVARRFLVAGF